MMLAASAFPGILSGIEDTPPVTPARKAPRGRPRVSDDPKMRRMHIAVAIHRLKLKNSVEQVCNRFNISPRTVHLWVGRVKTYPEASCLFPAPHSAR